MSRLRYSGIVTTHTDRKRNTMKENDELNQLREQVQRQQASLEAMRQLLIAAVMQHPDKKRVKRIFLENVEQQKALMHDDLYLHVLLPLLEQAVVALDKRIVVLEDEQTPP